MKTLLILRHAKAEAHGNAESDHGRALVPQGQDAAARMGVYLREKDLIPDIIFCSDAVRTVETLQRITPFLPDGIPQIVDQSFYLAEGSVLLRSVKNTEDTYQRILLIGHNPGCQELVLSLPADRNAASAMALPSKFPTAALAVLDFDIDQWSDLKIGIGYLVDLASPRELPDPST